MLLPHENTMQQTRLARCKNSRVAACFAHVASLALHVDINAHLITGDPDKCPSFLADLVDLDRVGANVPNAMRIPQADAFLTEPELEKLRQEIENMDPCVQTPSEMRRLPLLQLHVREEDTASVSEADWGL